MGAVTEQDAPTEVEAEIIDVSGDTTGPWPR
jgi:hypothetical protein